MHGDVPRNLGTLEKSRTLCCLNAIIIGQILPLLYLTEKDSIRYRATVLSVDLDFDGKNKNNE